MKRTKKTPIAQINVTPLADVCTTLIVIFMMILPSLMWTGILISSTKAVSSSEITPQENLPEVREICKIDIAKSQVYLNGTPVPEENLRMELERLISLMENKTVIVTSDPDVLFRKVVEIFDIAKQSGAEKLSLLKKG